MFSFCAIYFIDSLFCGIVSVTMVMLCLSLCCLVVSFSTVSVVLLRLSCVITCTIFMGCVVWLEV